MFHLQGESTLYYDVISFSDSPPQDKLTNMEIDSLQINRDGEDVVLFPKCVLLIENSTRDVQIVDRS